VVTVVNSGTCSPWALPADIGEPCNGAGFDAALLLDCLQAASDILFDLSGRQYAGACSDTVRPCARSVSVDGGRPLTGGYGPGSGGWSPGGGGSTWGFCSCQTSVRSGCNSLPEITLGVYPVTAVTQVKVDGAVVDSSLYRVDDNRWLVGLTNPVTGVQQTFPCCQRMDLPTTEKDTFEVAVDYGTAPPVLGKLACAELACQLSMAFKPSQGGDCQLPQHITQLTRLGETMTVLDPLSFKDGLLALPFCGGFLKSVNPYGIARRATVLSPDIGRRVRRAGT
jgi:hypothetical protein